MVTKKPGKGLAPESAEFSVEPVQARRFSKARKARSAATLEDYTEMIADLIAVNGEARTTDIARRLGVAHPTASKTIARLKREDSQQMQRIELPRVVGEHGTIDRLCLGDPSHSMQRLALLDCLHR